MQKKVHLKSSLLGRCNQKITRTEEEVLRLLKEEYETPNKIAIRRKTTKRAVYKIIRNLKKKGLYSPSEIKVHKNECISEHFLKNGIRLHALELNIKILHRDYRYKKKLDNCNIIDIDGNKVRLFDATIEIYILKSFYGEDTSKALARAFNYINRFLIRLEHDLKVILVKPRYQNIKIVKAHYAEVNNELAKECNINPDKIHIYAEEDGKLWFLIDNSFNLHEAETVHPKTAKQDMQDTVKPFFNDLRRNKGYTPQFVVNSLAEIAEHNRAYSENFKTHIGAIQKLGDQVNILGKQVMRFKKRLDQKNLKEWI